MYVRHWRLCAAFVLAAAAVCPRVQGQVSWTETFHEGVGRFTGVQGDGAARFQWNSGAQNLAASYIRYGQTDSRYAPLGQAYDAWSSTLRFSAAVQPLSGDGQSTRAVAQIGFMNSANSHSQNNICVWLGNWTELGGGQTIRLAGRYGSGAEVDPRGEPPSVSFSFGSWYFLDAVVDGPGRLFSVNVHQGASASGPLLATLSRELDASQPLLLDSVGLFNVGDGGPRTFVANVDTISVVVPGPGALTLFSVAGLAVRRRRRR